MSYLSKHKSMFDTVKFQGESGQKPRRSPRHPEAGYLGNESRIRLVLVKIWRREQTAERTLVLEDQQRKRRVYLCKALFVHGILRMRKSQDLVEYRSCGVSKNCQRLMIRLNEMKWADNLLIILAFWSFRKALANFYRLFENWVSFRNTRYE